MPKKHKKPTTYTAVKKSSLLETPYGLVIAFIVIFTVVTRLFRLGTPDTMYFDEVYHAFTAVRYIHNDPQAYDVYATPPEGFAFEWTHPPLAKLLMAGSMLLFGENAVGWRLSSVLFGSLCILMTALIAEEFFQSRRIAVLAALFLSLDGLLLAQSRIAMNDTHFLFFALLAVFAYLKSKKYPEDFRWLVLSGASVGLSLASKWTALYLVLIIGVDHLITWFEQRKLPSIERFLALCFVFGVLPAGVYLLSYAQFFSMGYSWDDFIALQKQMWWYHTNLVATHDYQSRPLQWLFGLRPVWYYVQYTEPNLISNIFNMANPVILLTGLVGVGFACWQWFKNIWDRKANTIPILLLLLYFGFWVPWLFSPRIMFSYHYMPALPGLCICLAFFIDYLLRLKEAKPSTTAWGLGVLTLVVGMALGWFVLFYPNLTAIPVPRDFADKVYAFVPSWK
jgi:dolichyl-phosphate-mannose--protein O-mannosyl transferase